MKKFIFLVTKILASLVFKLLFPIEIKGKENRPSKGPCIVAANHSSFLDGIVLGLALPRQANFFVKAPLFSVPVFSSFLRTIGMIPLDRDSLSSLSLRAGCKVLENNRVLALFPEGTRSKTREFLPAKPGAGFLHVKTGAPIVPVLIRGTEKAMPAGKKTLRIGTKIKVTFGKSFTTSERDKKTVAKIIMDEIAKLDRL